MSAGRGSKPADPDVDGQPLSSWACELEARTRLPFLLRFGPVEMEARLPSDMSRLQIAGAHISRAPTSGQRGIW